MMNRMRTWLWLSAVFLLLSCVEKAERLTPIWGEAADQSEQFDLKQIQLSGDLIALTLTGPQTCYDYHGRMLGLHYLLCEQFANTLGVRLRMDVCRDTTEMLQRLQAGEADLIAYPLTGDSLTAGWQVGEGKPLLAQALHDWYSPELKRKVMAEEQSLLTRPRVRRQVFAPMLGGGAISRYDALFRRYSRVCGWDWRLIAAQCYQESTFDPNAVSWAGARGLMQIMPATADHLRLPAKDIYDPEKNIEAACRLIRELNSGFQDVKERGERQKFVLAAYNGGQLHIRDAMRLCERDGKNAHRWDEVSAYVLGLSEPRYYRDSLVGHGYMRGQETVQYVEMIQQRYRKYIRSAK